MGDVTDEVEVESSIEAIVVVYFKYFDEPAKYGDMIKKAVEELV